MEAMGRVAFSPADHSTWPVAASTRMPAFALTPAGPPTTERTGPDVVFARAETGTIAVMAVDVEPDDGRVAPFA